MVFRQCVHDAADARPEAHVKHAVGLVKHQDLDAGQAHVVVLHEVKQTAGCGDQQVAALLQCLYLLVELGAAHDDDGALPGLLAHDLHDVVDLRGQLAGGRDHQGVRAAARLAGNALQRGQREGGRLARARLRGGDDVAPGEDFGDGARLHRRGRGEAEGVHPGKNLLV